MITLMLHGGKVPCTRSAIEETGRLAMRALAWHAAWDHLIASGGVPPLDDMELDRVTDAILDGTLEVEGRLAG
jgi:hypothetical protein